MFGLHYCLSYWKGGRKAGPRINNFYPQAVGSHVLLPSSCLVGPQILETFHGKLKVQQNFF